MKIVFLHSISGPRPAMSAEDRNNPQKPWLAPRPTEPRRGCRRPAATGLVAWLLGLAGALFALLATVGLIAGFGMAIVKAFLPLFRIVQIAS
jgi:hypothetical protein